jgi:hypothetical protein
MTFRFNLQIYLQILKSREYAMKYSVKATQFYISPTAVGSYILVHWFENTIIWTGKDEIM